MSAFLGEGGRRNISSMILRDGGSMYVYVPGLLCGLLPVGAKPQAKERDHYVSANVLDDGSSLGEEKPLRKRVNK